jgi:hypothetical protein
MSDLHLPARAFPAAGDLEDEMMWRVATILRISGVLLLVIGLAGYFAVQGPAHPTALIPAGLGVVALLASAIRNFWAAAGLGAAVCVLALVGGGSALGQMPAVLAGEAGAATASRAGTALVALLTMAGLAFATLRRAKEA